MGRDVGDGGRGFGVEREEQASGQRQEARGRSQWRPALALHGIASLFASLN